MVAIQAVYDGNVFIPEKPCEIISGSKVSLTIETINTGIYEKQKKLAALKQLSQELIDLNKTDPLPPEFDEVLSQRVHSEMRQQQAYQVIPSAFLTVEV